MDDSHAPYAGPIRPPAGHHLDPPRMARAPEAASSGILITRCCATECSPGKSVKTVGVRMHTRPGSNDLDTSLSCFSCAKGLREQPSTDARRTTSRVGYELDHGSHGPAGTRQTMYLRSRTDSERYGLWATPTLPSRDAEGNLTSGLPLGMQPRWADQRWKPHWIPSMSPDPNERLDGCLWPPEIM